LSSVSDLQGAAKISELDEDPSTSSEPSLLLELTTVSLELDSIASAEQLLVSDNLGSGSLLLLDTLVALELDKGVSLEEETGTTEEFFTQRTDAAKYL
jgi:hypothetical protein